MAEIDEYYDVAISLVKEAGKVIVEAMKKDKLCETKSSRVDLVTETDKEIELLLINGLKEKFPDHKFIAEETSEEGKCELTDSPTWIIDPIDGTMNFVHSYPNCCVSVGLAVKKKLELGIVYNPKMERLFTAKRGKGSYCNGEKLQVSNVKELSEGLMLSEAGSFRDKYHEDVFNKNMNAIFHNAHSLRCTGSAALNLCSVAAGEADVYVESGLHCWDVAAGSLIAHEAGATVMDMDGGPFDLMSRKIICSCCKNVADSTSKLIIASNCVTPDSTEPVLHVF